MYFKRFLHTMLRVSNLEVSIEFYTKYLGMKLLRQNEYPQGRFTLAFLGYDDESEVSVLELTYNWDEQDRYDLGSGFGHLAIASTKLVESCRYLESLGVKILRQPGPMKFDSNELIAFIEDPDGYKVELIEKNN